MTIKLKKIVAIFMILMMWTNAPADPRTLNDGVYTKDQAKIGEGLYTQHCILCHDKKYFRPVLKRWEGQAINVLFTVISASMPENNPGFLSEKEYVDILAYVLSLSRYAPGDTELDYQDGALNDLMVEARKRK
ncbi:MAG: c-type cytochrome [Woeseiaceae bacterium]